MVDKETEISCNHLIFLVKFQQSREKHIVDTLGMQTLLRKHKKLYLESIKMFDSDKEKFVRLAKHDLNSYTNMYTELNENLRERNFIN